MAWCFHTSMVFPKGHLTFVEKWPMMNPNEIAFVLGTYLLFVWRVGPLLMEGRNPVPIKAILIFYNAFKVINSAFLTFKYISYVIDKGLFPGRCEYDEATIYVTAMLYWKYMAMRVFDLCDTVFLVFRKRYGQVSFLHVYQRIFMVAVSWSCLKYDPSEHWAFMGLVTCAMFTVMYLYNLITALGPWSAGLLWWKPYLFVLQMIQIVLVGAHMTMQAYTSECPINPTSYRICLSNLGLFICLLYMDSYTRRYRTSDKNSVALPCKSCNILHSE